MECSGEPSNRKRGLSDYKVCPHCSCKMKSKKFREHRRLFYDDVTEVWAKEIESDTSGSESSEFSEVHEAVQQSNTLDEPESDWEGVFEEDLQSELIDQPEQHSDEASSSEHNVCRGIGVSVHRQILLTIQFIMIMIMFFMSRVLGRE